ncbi:hypothetical protein ACIOHS_01860 [Streptomyces sp. NPDC088253]|uniref:hypothetical protein n=1 Tax=Streptomyces sp. NPDC088253 TaxID=3365846 RepID=UPI003802F53E
MAGAAKGPERPVRHAASGTADDHAADGVARAKPVAGSAKPAPWPRGSSVIGSAVMSVRDRFTAELIHDRLARLTDC